MGDVAISIRVMLESPDVDLEKIKVSISEFVDIKDFNVEEIGFGLKALKVLLVRPDSDGGTEDVEAKIKNLDGVKDVEVEDVTLL